MARSACRFVSPGGRPRRSQPVLRDLRTDSSDPLRDGDREGERQGHPTAVNYATPGHFPSAIRASDTLLGAHRVKIRLRRRQRMGHSQLANFGIRDSTHFGSRTNLSNSVLGFLALARTSERSRRVASGFSVVNPGPEGPSTISRVVTLTSSQDLPRAMTPFDTPLHEAMCDDSACCNTSLCEVEIQAQLGNRPRS